MSDSPLSDGRSNLEGRPSLAVARAELLIGAGVMAMLVWIASLLYLCVTVVSQLK